MLILLYPTLIMSVLLEQALLEQAIQLPIPERIKLVEEIWDSIEADPAAFELTAEQKAELERRIEDHRLHPEDSMPWETVLAEARARK